MNKPWYKHFWFWFVIAPPAASIVAGVFLLVTALTNADDLVVDDYRKIGRAFEQQTERDRAARDLGVSAVLSLDRDDGSINLRLTVGAAQRNVGAAQRDVGAAQRNVGAAQRAAIPAAIPAAVSVHAVHPTDAARDLQTTLTLGPDGLHRGRFDTPVHDRRYLRVYPADGSWRLVGTLEAADESLDLGDRRHSQDRAYSDAGGPGDGRADVRAEPNPGIVGAIL